MLSQTCTQAMFATVLKPKMHRPETILDSNPGIKQRNKLHRIELKMGMNILESFIFQTKKDSLNSSKKWMSYASQTWTQSMFAATQNNYRQKSVPESILQQSFEHSNDNIFQPKFAKIVFNMQATKFMKFGSISLSESKDTCL